MKYLAIAPALIFALPTGVEGPAKLDAGQNSLNITVGDHAHLQWKSFSIGKGESVNFTQPGVNSVVINHVTGGEISQILGKMSAKGTVYLVNPSGIFVGREAIVDVGALIASTMQGVGSRVEERYNLTDSGGKITVDGKIIARTGDVILASHHVACRGEVIAEKGIAIAAGKEVVIQPGHEAKAYIKAIGGQRITHDGNLYSLAINQEGLVDGEVIIRGSIGAKEVIISSGKAELFGKVQAERIDCRATESIWSSGTWKGKEIGLHTGGSLSLGRVDLAEGGKIALQMRQAHSGRLPLEELLKKGDVTLLAKIVRIGDVGSFSDAVTSESPYCLRLEGDAVLVREGMTLGKDLQIKAQDLTIGADDHKGSEPVAIESKKGTITLEATRFHLFDGKEKVTLCAKEIAIASDFIEMIAEGKGCDLHADAMLKLMGAQDLLIDARGKGSEIALRAGGIALKNVDKSAFLAQGEGARVQVRAETALGMSGGTLSSQAIGMGSQVELSAPKMALRLRDFEISASGAASKGELISGALQLATDKTITLAASGRDSLAQIALTTGGRNFILAGEDFICKGSLGKAQIADLGGPVGLVVYAGRDLLFDSRATVEIQQGDFMMEAGRDLIFRNRPRMLTQRKEQPSLQIVGHVVGERRNESLTLGDFFQKIAAREKEASVAFLAFSDELKHSVAPRLESIELFDMRNIEFFPVHGLAHEYVHFEVNFGEIKERIEQNRRSIEHVLCQSMRALGLQGKFAQTLRRSLLKEPVAPQVAPKDRPWKVWAESDMIDENIEQLAADIE